MWGYNVHITFITEEVNTVVISGIFLRNCRLRTPAGTAAILTDDFRRFSQSPPKIKFEILRQLGHDRFLTSPFLEFFYSPIILSTPYTRGGHNVPRARHWSESREFAVKTIFK
jgi:hypothetical protein